jgi:hypothetical protein
MYTQVYRKLIWGTLVPGHHASNTYILLTIMHTQGYIYPRYIYPTHTYPKYAYPRYIYPGYTYPIYIYPEYIYIHTFTYLRYIFQKNNIPKVYIPHLCLLSMCKVIHTLGYVQNITYFVRIEHGARAPRYIYIYVCVCVYLAWFAPSSREYYLNMIYICMLSSNVSCRLTSASMLENNDAARCWCKSPSSWEPQEKGMMSTVANFSLSKKPRFIESRKKPNSRRWCLLASRQLRKIYKAPPPGLCFAPAATWNLHTTQLRTLLPTFDEVVNLTGLL